MKLFVVFISAVPLATNIFVAGARPASCASNADCCKALGDCDKPTCNSRGRCTNDRSCGDLSCGNDEYCCNEDLGLCASAGVTEDCNAPVTLSPNFQVEPTCGGNKCGPTEYCCNSSCGICAPVGGFCTLQFCYFPEDPLV